MKIAAWLAGHRKFLAAIAGAATTASVSEWGTANRWVELAVLAASALGIYAVPNRK